MNWIAKFIKPKIKSLLKRNHQRQKIFGLHVDVKFILRDLSLTKKFALSVELTTNLHAKKI